MKISYSILLHKSHQPNTNPIYMTQTKEQSIDILAGFTLHSALSFTEMVIYNYAKIYETKEEILGHTRRFFTVNPIRI